MEGVPHAMLSGLALIHYGDQEASVKSQGTIADLTDGRARDNK